MIIDLSTIKDEVKGFHIVYDISWWIREGEHDPVLGFLSPFVMDIQISKIKKGYMLEGKVTGKILVRCDRCLEEVEYFINPNFRLFLKQSPPPLDIERELSKDELLEDYIETEEFDTDPILREQIYLSLPMKFLCKQECKGMCPRCGTNLNKENCSCEPEVSHPAFLKLKELKLS